MICHWTINGFKSLFRKLHNRRHKVAKFTSLNRIILKCEINDKKFFIKRLLVAFKTILNSYFWSKNNFITDKWKSPNNRFKIVFLFRNWRCPGLYKINTVLSFFGSNSNRLYSHSFSWWIKHRKGLQILLKNGTTVWIENKTFLVSQKKH